jgi:hypothetical protein
LHLEYSTGFAVRANRNRWVRCVAFDVRILVVLVLIIAVGSLGIVLDDGHVFTDV